MTDPYRVRTIVVAMDFSPASLRALELARDLAEAAGPAHIILVHGYFVPPDIEAFAGAGISDFLADLSERATRDLEAALKGLQDAGISSEYMALHGSPDRVIPQLAADKNADLIVMGTHGRTGLSRLALGSVAERVVQTAPCPVLTVRVDP